MYGFEDHLLHEFNNDAAENIDQLMLLNTTEEELLEMGFSVEVVEGHYAAL